ncbi:MAG: helix-hairpin-helix domain-containing protein [Halioglobus sp.]
MNHSSNVKAGAASATIINPLRYMALLVILLSGLLFNPVQAQEGRATDGVVTTININTADAAALAAGLNGVGASRAEDIIRYREEFGAFTTVEQLAEVKGVGKSTLEKNRSRITLE